MTNLIAFEVKKFFKRKKNLIGIGMLIILTIIYVSINIFLEKQILDYDITSCTLEMESVHQALTSLKVEYDKETGNGVKVRMKKIIDDYESQVILLTQKKAAIEKDDWKEKLYAEVKLDKMTIKGINGGTVISGEDRADIEERIKKNEILLDKNIEPIIENCSMNSYNFIRRAGSDIVPLILIILLFLLSSDSISNEIEEGTFKLLLIQPISRKKIMMSKIISYTLICIVTVVTIFLSFFLVLGLVKGFGSMNYPTEYYTGSFSSIFKAGESYEVSMIGMGSFILYMIPLYVLLIITIVAIAVLISTLIGNSAGAISVSVIIYTTFYIFNSKLRILDKMAEIIPFTYGNIPGILSGAMITEFGNKNITCINGIIVLILTTILCYFLSFIAFRKKDIL